MTNILVTHPLDIMPSLVIFLSHSKDPEGFLLDRVANLSDVAGVVRVVGLIRVVVCVGASQGSR